MPKLIDLEGLPEAVASAIAETVAEMKAFYRKSEAGTSSEKWEGLAAFRAMPLLSEKLQ